MTVYMKKGDRLPLLQAELTDASGTPLNLTGATVTFKMRSRNGTVLKVNAAASVISAELGVVQYAWGATDTDTEGSFDAEFVASFGGLPMTVPGAGAFLIVIGSGL